jgi:hypothetical protein
MSASRQGSWDKFLFINNWKNDSVCKCLCYIWSVNWWVNNECLNWFVLQGTRYKLSFILIKSSENYFTVFWILFVLNFAIRNQWLFTAMRIIINYVLILRIFVWFVCIFILPPYACLAVSLASLAEKYKRKLTSPHNGMRSLMISIARVNCRKSLWKYTCQS